MLVFPLCCPGVVAGDPPVVFAVPDEVLLLSEAEDGDCAEVLLSPCAVFEVCVVFLCLCGDEFDVFLVICDMLFVCGGCGLFLLTGVDTVGVCVGPSAPPCPDPLFPSFFSCSPFCSGVPVAEEGLAGVLDWLGVTAGLLAAGEGVVDDVDDVERVCSWLLVSFVDWLTLGLPKLVLEVVSGVLRS